MRTLTKLLLMVGLALTMSTSAQAIISVSLVQVGGTYVAGAATAGDTLVLDIQYNITGASATTLIDPGLVFNGAVTSFNVAGSTETAFAAWAGGAGAISPIGTGDIALVSGIANGWEKGTTGTPASAPCVFGACTSMGTAAFVLSGTSGVISVGGHGINGGTTITDGAGADITLNGALVSLGTFQIVAIPEPTTASLLGLGLLGLTVAGRRRKN